MMSWLWLILYLSRILFIHSNHLPATCGLQIAKDKAIRIYFCLLFRRIATLRTYCGHLTRDWKWYFPRSRLSCWCWWSTSQGTQQWKRKHDMSGNINRLMSVIRFLSVSNCNVEVLIKMISIVCSVELVELAQVKFFIHLEMKWYYETQTSRGLTKFSPINQVIFYNPLILGLFR